MSNLKDYAAEGFTRPKPRTPLKADPAVTRAWQDRTRRPLPRRSISRTPDERKVARDDIPPLVRAAVRARSGGRCEIDHEGCWGEARHMHHRKMRSQGGPHTEANLIHLCVPGHHEAHHASDRYERGWLIRSGDPITPLR